MFVYLDPGLVRSSRIQHKDVVWCVIQVSTNGVYEISGGSRGRQVPVTPIVTRHSQTWLAPTQEVYPDTQTKCAEQNNPT